MSNLDLVHDLHKAQANIKRALPDVRQGSEASVIEALAIIQRVGDALLPGMLDEIRRSKIDPTM